MTLGIGHAGAVDLHPAIAAPLDDAVTQRLSIRRLRDDDLDGLTTIYAHPEVWWFEYERAMTRVETQAFLDRQLNAWNDFGFGACGVRETLTPDLIGVVGLSVPTALQDLLPALTVGWRFSPSSWGRGYATEAATAVLDQVFTTMALDRVGCVTNAENLRSVRLAERLGMSRFAQVTVPRDDGSRMVEATLFQITSRDWLALRDEQSQCP